LSVRILEISGESSGRLAQITAHHEKIVASTESSLRSLVSLAYGS
jgi:hypothetical protein